jgi:2-polyprenyl-3-methyl-5-hydroxy-6-metoxy-1,4-benzoquinol methylase
MSKLSERRYRRKGLDDHQKYIVESLESIGLNGVSLLEVGCGVGVLHQTLLEKGAATAVGIDLAPRALEFAQSRASERQLDQRTEYKLGDIVEMSDTLDPVDITVMDKVVCCYPAPKELIEAAMTHTRGAIALTYPRKHFFSELSNHLWNFGFWLFRSDFRSFVHDPLLVQRSIEAFGFHRVFNHDSSMWHTQVYTAN